jgi:hypothetical protein
LAGALFFDNKKTLYFAEAVKLLMFFSIRILKGDGKELTIHFEQRCVANR